MDIGAFLAESDIKHLKNKMWASNFCQLHSQASHAMIYQLTKGLRYLKLRHILFKSLYECANKVLPLTVAARNANDLIKGYVIQKATTFKICVKKKIYYVRSLVSRMT